MVVVEWRWNILHSSHIGDPFHFVGQQQGRSRFSNEEEATCNCSNNNGEDIKVPSPG